ncbi:unnamed protein product [Symbiodinium sp. KB8]|nr:unnamed protein product [Symbiodinium sp. KB8]
MADVLPALEVAFVDHFWEWNGGKGLPANRRWCPLSKRQQRLIREESPSLTLLQDNRTFRKVAQYDSEIMLFQADGMDIGVWSYVRALVRPVGPDMLLSVHADHMPTDGLLKFQCRSCISARALVHLHVIDAESLSMNVLELKIKRLCVDRDFISPQQQLRLVSSASGELMNSFERFFVWGPKVAGVLRPRKRLVKKTTASKVCLRKFFLPCSS